MGTTVSHPIDATFRDNSSQVTFRQRYRSRKGFLQSLARSKKVTFLHAVDHVLCIVVYPHTLEEYRNG